MKFLCRLSFVLMCLFSLPALSQPGSAINSIITKINSRNTKFPIEKLYLQSDKAGYIQGDTIWFKAYLLNADLLTASTRSGLLYVEMDDINNKCVKRIMIPLVSGLSWGNIALDADEFPEGGYTLRAYTNWMLNFGEDYVFKKDIYITAVGAQSRLITSDFKAVNQAGKNNIQAALLFSDLSNQPVRLQDMQLRVMDGNHTLFKDKATTGVDGKINFNFDIPDNTRYKNLSIVSRDIIKGAGEAPVFTIPVTLKHPEDVDLQFMPDGGALVLGLQSKVGFKAIGEDGKGIDVSGEIYDSKQQEVTTFASVHNGMGAFELTPQAGESYTAKIDLPNGSIKSYPLPKANPSGACLRIENRKTVDDSLKVIISVTPDLLTVPAAVYYFVGQSGGAVYYAAYYSIKNTESIFLVPKSIFPAGIVHFTLFNNANLPIAERIVYINNGNHLQLSITLNQKTYAPHDSIALNIKVTDKSGKPVRGSFSIAVTDDSQVKTDSMGSNIVNNMLLASDLKGTVEDPGYYFEDNSPARAIELDNLMLTQGWVGYDWKQVFAAETKPEFAAEPEFAIQGTVTNVFNKPVKATEISLLSIKPTMLIDTITDNNGRFTFKGFLPIDTAAFMIQARNKKGKSHNVGINIDEFKPPVFTQTSWPAVPWYVNTDTLLLHSVNNQVIKQLEEQKLIVPGHMLKVVTIKGKKIIKGSKNLNGPGESDQVLDANDMVKAGKITLADLLEQKIKGFRTGYIPRTPIMAYYVNDARVKFVMDGMYLDKFYTPTTGQSNDYYQYIKQYLDYYTAEDITGIEVMYSMAYSSQYISTFISPLKVGDLRDPIAFIEITTRSGQGPFMKRTAGTYLYRPLAVTLPQQFYRPKYNVKNPPKGVDLRSTIHWEPNIVTDSAGKATVSFYSADKPANYTIIMEGADLNGLIGFERKRIVVK